MRLSAAAALLLASTAGFLAGYRCRHPKRRPAEPLLAQPSSHNRVAQMAAELKALKEELEVRTTQVRHAHEAAEQALRARNQFLASMSHELRTPLNAIIGFAQMLQREYFGVLAQKQHEYVEDIQQSARHLLSVISAILDLSKIASGRTASVTETINLAELCRSVIAVSVPLAEENGNALVLGMETAPETIESDPTKLRQCLLNLLGNACKFTQNGRVELTVRAVERSGAQWASFAVADTGIGIAEENRGRLFRVFSQADPMISERFGGSGLGLALTAQFAALLGGTVSYESVLGRGSTFTLRLPVSAPVIIYAAQEAQPLPITIE